MSTAIRRAIYGKLAGDGTLTGMLASAASGYTQAIYHQDAPQDAGYPFILFDKAAGNNTETFGDAAAFGNDIWMVKAIDRDTTADKAEAIHDRIYALLTDANLSISGLTLCYLRTESDVDYAEDVDGMLYRHCGALYRVIVTD